jgi:rhodanese-related sulfurtransferase
VRALRNDARATAYQSVAEPDETDTTHRDGARRIRGLAADEGEHPESVHLSTSGVFLRDAPRKVLDRNGRRRSAEARVLKVTNSTIKAFM